MIDVVAAEAGAHELLEEVGLFVAALGGAEAGQRLEAVRVAQALELAGGEVECFVPGCFAEHIAPARGVADLGRNSSATPGLRISGFVSRCG